MQPTSNGLAVIERSTPAMSDDVAVAVARGDLSKLSGAQLAEYVKCLSAEIDVPVALTPVLFLPAQGGKLVPYITAAGTNMIRDRRRVSIRIVARERSDGLYIVTARASTPDGREDEATGIVVIEGMKGTDLANAMMKAETKAKRRATLSIAGIGMPDESEADTIASAGRPRRVDLATGELFDADSRVVIDRPADGTDVAMRRLHAVGKDRDLAHEDLRTIVQFFYPAVQSLKECTEDQLRTVAGLVETASDEEITTWVTDWADMIAASQTPEELASIANLMSQRGISSKTHQHLLGAYNRRKIDLAKEKAAAQPSFAETADNRAYADAASS